MPREYKMYINGEWVNALDGEAYGPMPSVLLKRQQRRFPGGHIRSRPSARPCS